MAITSPLNPHIYLFESPKGKFCLTLTNAIFSYYRKVLKTVFTKIVHSHIKCLVHCFFNCLKGILGSFAAFKSLLKVIYPMYPFTPPQVSPFIESRVLLTYSRGRCFHSFSSFIPSFEANSLSIETSIYPEGFILFNYWLIFIFQK